MDKPYQPPDRPSSSYVSPKLREKLNEPGGSSPRDDDQLPPWLGWLVLGLLAVAVAVVAVGVLQSNAEKKRQAVAARADSVRAAAAADSAAAVAAVQDSIRLDSLRALMPSPKPGASPPAKPGVAPRAGSTPGGSAAGGAASAPAAETRRYGLAVAEFIDEDRANSEKDRLAASTGLTGRVVSVDNGNAFRVILGSFEGRAAADKAAAELSGKGLVNEARVTPLPR
jgi:cell division protein FtsN